MIGVYVHLPFCLRKCDYCGFFSVCGQEDTMDAYVERVIREAETFLSTSVDTIYFGGGTPSVLPTPLLTKLLHALCNRFSGAKEITIEVNPATVTSASLCELFAAGFNRISIGVQSLQNEELRLLGRLHTAEEALSCIQMAHEAGFPNISADVMFGIPGQTLESLRETMHTLVTLPISHISTYSLSIEEGTPLASRALSLPDEETEREMYYTIRDILKGNGFSHYEISNFARPTMESMHNTNYWECGEYIGLGAGAHGYYAGVRYSNVEDIQKYITSSSPRDSEMALTARDRSEEYYMLGLRMLKGVKDDGNPNIPRLIEEGLLARCGENVHLTDRGLDIANYVITELFV